MNPQDIDWLSFIVTILMLAIIAGGALLSCILDFGAEDADEYQDQDNWGAK